jgi:hypothetical protein
MNVFHVVDKPKVHTDSVLIEEDNECVSCSMDKNF